MRFTSHLLILIFFTALNSTLNAQIQELGIQFDGDFPDMIVDRDTIPLRSSPSTDASVTHILFRGNGLKVISPLPPQGSDQQMRAPWLHISIPTKPDSLSGWVRTDQVAPINEFMRQPPTPAADSGLPALFRELARTQWSFASYFDYETDGVQYIDFGYPVTDEGGYETGTSTHVLSIKQTGARQLEMQCYDELFDGFFGYIYYPPPCPVAEYPCPLITFRRVVDLAEDRESILVNDYNGPELRRSVRLINPTKYLAELLIDTISPAPLSTPTLANRFKPAALMRGTVLKVSAHYSRNEEPAAPTHSLNVYTMKEGWGAVFQIRKSVVRPLTLREAIALNCKNVLPAEYDSLVGRRYLIHHPRCTDTLVVTPNWIERRSAFGMKSYLPYQTMSLPGSLYTTYEDSFTDDPLRKGKVIISENFPIVQISPEGRCRFQWHSNGNWNEAIPLTD